jgi:hypothetical protein
LPGDDDDEADEEEDEGDPVDEEEERAQGEEEDEGDEDNEGYAESETSSAMFDPDADPEGFAKRLDELAGVKEIGEEETRALKWGPPIARGADGELKAEIHSCFRWEECRAKLITGKLAHSPLPLEAFRKVIDHYLTSTEWKYANTPSGAGHGPDALEDGLTGMNFDSHPISVFGQTWGGGIDREEVHTSSGVSEGRALGIEGLPVTTRFCEWGLYWEREHS